MCRSSMIGDESSGRTRHRLAVTVHGPIASAITTESWVEQMVAAANELQPAAAWQLSLAPRLAKVWSH